ncbi:hypothetical protein CAPN010_04840 [Capnocytophaga cynodegmi]|uniref:retron system putative HNH endonuclease n=1 Tax=Capnocytophaga TaxID=1016 RepID=UPI001EE16697|nr:retron system putative HNH endonuclease [Capnocytophaga cynodegmi]GJQ06326.1 hypothetical protein CAPN010_04840 [Capnocytophaga cynodegmi]
MRKINKASPPSSFTDFVREKSPINWSCCPSNVKQEAREQMILEQDFLCGYTEIYIDENDCHIDHYIKRDINNSLCYDWNNLIVAVNDNDFGAKHKDSGGNRVKSLADYSNLLNPVTDNTQAFFKYTLDGTINIADNLSNNDKTKAQHTIEVFNLNHSSLKKRRKEIAHMIVSLRKGGLSDQEVLNTLKTSGFRSFVEFVLREFQSI